MAGNESMEGVRSTILITVDSLRADSVLRSYTPAINEVAERGTVFENAFSYSHWTPFSFPSILSPKSVFSDSPDIELSPAPTLAEMLRREGVRTGGFTAINGILTHHWGYNRGFDEFENFGGWANRSRFLASHPTTQSWVYLSSLLLTSPARWI
ncbi:MAG: sulfatase-like hydrolase/transferase, partial [Halobacteria archaeon]|nr:sulfatase-like hydrolase/transferase [Halobacteria archaeon]